MGFFRRKNAKSKPVPNRDEMIQLAVGYLTKAFQAEGIPAEQVLTENGHCLQINDGSLVSLENLADQMQQVPSDEWESLFGQWFQFVMDATRKQDPSDLDPESLASMIRSRIVSTNGREYQQYARPVAEGLAEVLCLDYPQHVAFVSDDSLGELQLPADELFNLGRRNTENDPVDEIVEHEGVLIVSGETAFTSSKISNMSALASQVGIEAPDGLLFGLLDKSVLVLKAPTGAEDLYNVMNVMRSLSLSLDVAPISPEIYYWSSDGSIELASQTIPSESGNPNEDTVQLMPGEEFTRRFMQE
ncbi:hypothetical protein [Corynebacterium mayonis]|uniref:hypothetical protein n=1 Tax=Corynebacterium mayonis TaxID=3062461 RepID=UPI00314099CA